MKLVNLPAKLPAVLLVALVGCGGSLTQTISIDRESIQTTIAEFFPLSSDELGEAANLPISFSLTDPEVLLEAGSDQVGLRLKIVSQPKDENTPAPPAPPAPPGGKPPFGSPPDKAPPKELEGTVSVAGNISYKPEEAAFYILDPKIKELNFPKLPQQFEPAVRTAAEALLAKYLEENSVYTLSDDDLKGQAAKSVLKSVSVKDGKLDVEIGW